MKYARNGATMLSREANAEVHRRARENFGDYPEDLVESVFQFLAEKRDNFTYLAVDADDRGLMDRSRRLFTVAACFNEAINILDKEQGK